MKVGVEVIKMEVKLGLQIRLKMKGSKGIKLQRILSVFCKITRTDKKIETDYMLASSFNQS